MYLPVKCIPYALLPILLLNGRCADAYSEVDVFDLSLEQLLDVKVTTVSKRIELLREAPGVVSVISAMDIRTFGARNIRDVLQRIPNFYMFDSPTWSSSGVSLRAGATQHLNNHVLYLIDGRPLRESQNGGLQSDINLILPLAVIERIEVIRGPGSVLYGSNAFSGTINFITKTPDEGLAASLQGQYGSGQYSKKSAAVSAGFGDDEGVQLRLTQLEDNGFSVAAIDEAGEAGSHTLYRDGLSALLTADYRGFSVNGVYSDLTLPMLSGENLWANKASLQLVREFADLGYKHVFSSGWQAELHYGYNNQERNIDGPNTGSSEYQSLATLYEASVSGALGPVNLLLGVVQEKLEGDLGEFGGAYQSKREGSYAQLDYRLGASTKSTVGFQWNKLEGLEADISPRFALTHSFDKAWSAKMLYAEAFRSPYGSELFFDSSYLVGDLELKPEEIATAELQLLYGGPGRTFIATIYQSNMDNTIGRAPRDGVNMFVNLEGEINAKGVELESKWSLNPYWQVQGSYSYQLNSDEDGNEDVMAASTYMAKIGLSYHGTNGFVAGLWNSYFGPVSKLENMPDQNVQVLNPAADAYSLLSLNLNFDMADLFDKPSLKGLELSIYANNILDQAVWYPELSRLLVNTYPQSHARGAYASFRYAF